MVAAGRPAAAQVRGSFARVMDTAAGTTFDSLQPRAGVNYSGLVAFLAVDSSDRDRYFTGRPGGNPVLIADGDQGERIHGSSAFVPVSDRGNVPYWRQVGTDPASILQHPGPSEPSVTIAASPTFDLGSPQSTIPNINSANPVVSFGRTPAGGPGVYVATKTGSSVSYTTIADAAMSSIAQPIGARTSLPAARRRSRRLTSRHLVGRRPTRSSAAAPTPIGDSRDRVVPGVDCHVSEAARGGRDRPRICDGARGVQPTDLGVAEHPPPLPDLQRHRPALPARQHGLVRADGR